MPTIWVKGIWCFSFEMLKKSSDSSRMLAGTHTAHSSQVDGARRLHGTRPDDLGSMGNVRRLPPLDSATFGPKPSTKRKRGCPS